MDDLFEFLLRVAILAVLCVGVGILFVLIAMIWRLFWRVLA